MNEQTNNTPNFIDENITSWTTEEVFENLFKFFSRVKFACELVPNEEGAFVGRQIVIICDDSLVESDVVPLDWPLMAVPAPEGYTVN